jgi:hypothetical protein
MAAEKGFLPRAPSCEHRFDYCAILIWIFTPVIRAIHLSFQFKPLNVQRNVISPFCVSRTSNEGLPPINLSGAPTPSRSGFVLFVHSLHFCFEIRRIGRSSVCRRSHSLARLPALYFTDHIHLNQQLGGLKPKSLRKHTPSVRERSYVRLLWYSAQVRSQHALRASTLFSLTTSLVL